MPDNFWKSLKSGTDIRGVASEGVDGETVTLTDSTVCAIADAFAVWLCKTINKTTAECIVSIGHDSRISADRIRNNVVKTLSGRGFHIIDCGLSSTPAMFMTTVDICCDAAVQITASHHPFNRNGLKFFLKSGGLEASDIDEILEIAARGESLPPSDGSMEKKDYMAVYSARLRKVIKNGVSAKDAEKPLLGFKISVDAGNGAGGFYAENVLRPLGADIGGSRYLEPDGMFPNHIPNPENKAAMEAASSAVLESGSDLGIVFDTDVDRAAVVDSRGEEINRNRLIALASAIALEGNEGGTIVTDSITSDGLTEYIDNNLGGRHFRYKRGYKNVIDKAQELNQNGVNCPLAIETSGHAALRENYFLDDGAYLVTKIIILMARLAQSGKKIGDLLSSLKEPRRSIELRYKIERPDYREYGSNIISGITDFAAMQSGWHIVPENYEGVRVSAARENGDGWFLLRMSVHDPILVLNIESNSENGADVILSKLCEYINTVKEINLLN